MQLDVVVSPPASGVAIITWIRPTATIPGQIWRQYEGPQMAF